MLKSKWFYGLLLCVGGILALGFKAGNASHAGAEQQPSGNYLPLAVGNRWVLRSKTVSTPIVLEVTEKSDSGYLVKFDNPWVDSVLELQPAGDAVTLASVSMAGQRQTMPPRTVYFDFHAGTGDQWSNHIGNLRVVSRNKTVKTRHGQYENCVEIREVNSKGDQLLWFFAPGVGFVQFGEGAWAFVLDESSSRLPGQPSPPTPPVAEANAGARASVAPAGNGKVWIALAANPAASESFGPKTVNARFDQSLRAGVTYLYLSPKWNELEPRKGSYNFKDLDFQVSQAVRSNLPIMCNLRIVDTNQRSMPKDLEGRSFADREMRDRLLSLIDAVIPHLKGHARYMLIGNEIDGYFKQHRSEVGDYSQLFQAGAERIRQRLPGVGASASVTFDGISAADSLLKPILQLTDFFALTYYPLHPDFTVRDPQEVTRDFDRIIAAANGKKILLQEVGYPSSATNNSSEDKQAEMFRNIFEQLQAHQDRFIGAYFFMMSDLPDSVVNQLAGYYKLPNADRFKAFLKSLGMFDDEGRAKKSWSVFQEEAARMKG